uniref:Uncharacterized protein n=1 Tax=Eutreptiella gymnastica TaxID=73025 RepID=A0A7S4FRS4_9EUGL
MRGNHIPVRTPQTIPTLPKAPAKHAAKLRNSGARQARRHAIPKHVFARTQGHDTHNAVPASEWATHRLRGLGPCQGCLCLGEPPPPCHEGQGSLVPRARVGVRMTRNAARVLCRHPPNVA